MASFAPPTLLRESACPGSGSGQNYLYCCNLVTNRRWLLHWRRCTVLPVGTIGWPIATVLMFVGTVSISSQLLRISLNFAM